MSVLAVAVLGAAALLAAGMRNLNSSPGDVIATQKAAQAVESVFAARDSHKLTWAQIRNVRGAGNDNGIFADGAQPLHEAGPDGLVNTSDDAARIESVGLPGRDQLLGTDDDDTVVLEGYTREITIRDVAGAGGQLRSITVTMTYRSGAAVRTYTLRTYISAYS